MWISADIFLVIWPSVRTFDLVIFASPAARQICGLGQPCAPRAIWYSENIRRYSLALGYYCSLILITFFWIKLLLMGLCKIRHGIQTSRHRVACLPISCELPVWRICTGQNGSTVMSSRSFTLFFLQRSLVTLWIALGGRKMGLVRITSWYPNFNGSHFGLPPSVIHRMTELPPKIVFAQLPLNFG